MKCTYCHIASCLENKCICYIVECRDGLTCSNCARSQNDLFLANDLFLKDESILNLSEPLNLIHEIVTKLHLMPSIAVKSSQEYCKIKKKIPNSTKSNASLILYIIKRTCDDEGLILPLKKICFLMKIPEQDFFLTEKFLFRKKVQHVKEINLQKKCDSIFECLQIYDPKIRGALFSECQKLQKKTDYRIENICATIFILYKYIINKKKIKIYFNTCEEKLNVKIYSVKKILKKYYNINLK